MVYICSLHTKGGVGKTTTTLYAATAASRDDLSVEVWDCDPQGSATSWSNKAVELGSSLDFPVVPVSGKNILTRKSDSEFVFIDTPPGNSDVISPAIERADFIIIPTGTSPLDIDRVWPTVEITRHRPTVVLLTRVNPKTKLLTVVSEVFESQKIAVFGTVINNREAFKQSYGSRPSDLLGYDLLWKEIKEVLL